MTREEIMRISQFVISSVQLGAKTLKFSKSVMAFTEHGVAIAIQGCLEVGVCQLNESRKKTLEL
jgi:hypothetical protein